MQTQLLTEYPSEPLRVYAVWLPMLWSDSRVMWNGLIMPDARVMHYWDGNHTVGRWFAREIDGYEGIAWDAYYLYGPDALWDTRPTPLTASGGTIYGKRKSLEIQVRALLGK